jgi:DNA-binding MarR family transcriptional regulator
MSTGESDPRLDRLGYLLKHAQEALRRRTAPALAPFDIDGRGLAVLRAVLREPPPSQQEAAEILGVDRTTMVALIDDLERKGLVVRMPHPGDRRKNVVMPTELGVRAVFAGGRASDEAEQEFLGPLTPDEVDALKRYLRALI